MTTTTYAIRRYSDSSSLGSVDLTPQQFARYESLAQQPEGIIALADLMDGLCSGNEYDIFDLDHEDQDTSVTVYLD